MVSNKEYGRLTKEETEGLRRNRIDLKNMWCTEAGIKQFLNMAKACSLFDKIDATDGETIGARNLFVDMCTEMGLFDEEFLKRTMRQLKEFPDIPYIDEHNAGDGETI